MFGTLFALVPMRRNVLRVVAGVSMLSFLILWNEFDHMDGFHHFDRTPSKNPLSVSIPIVEAITWGSLIAFDDGAGFRLPAWF